MELLYLSLIFATVIIVLLFKRPLYQAVLCALIVCCLLFGISPTKAAELTLKVLTQWSSLSVLVSLYLIVLLQHILEKRDQIMLAQKDLDSLFHNRRINASIAPIFIGLLPHAGAMILCSDIVKDATDPYLEPEEQSFVTSWFRHIPESTLPTYTGVLLMSTLSGISLNRFVPLMIVSVFAYLTIIIFEPHSIYGMRLARQGKLITHHTDHAVLTLMSLDSVIDHDYMAVEPDMEQIKTGIVHGQEEVIRFIQQTQFKKQTMI